MKKEQLTFSNIIFALFIIAMLIPQSRMAIQVALNKAKVFVFSPSKLNDDEQLQLQPFTYLVNTLDGVGTAVEVGQDKVTFISYWATWCPPCVAEMPSILKLHADYGDKINFLLLTNEAPETVSKFLNEKGYDLPVYFPKIRSPKLLDSPSIPTNFIIDKSGKIIIKETGATDWNSDKVRGVLEELIK